MNVVSPFGSPGLPVLLAAAGIPERFRDRTLESYGANCEGTGTAKRFAVDFVERFDESRGRGAMLLGNVGTGKTHLACAICRQLLVDKPTRKIMYASVQRAVRRIKETWGKGSGESEAQAIEALARPDLLILDEVGVQFGSETERSLLFDVLNERYERRRATIFISNHNRDEVAAFLGARVIDRMREDDGALIVFDWESHRGR
jgi:DNA replication protein DnaC